MTHRHRRVEAGPAGGFDVHTRDSGRPGPRVVVLGGVHGDETEGLLAAGRLAGSDFDVAKGRLDVVPICHEAAFAADSRTSPLDGANLARVFPGDPDGSPTSRLAHHLRVEVLDGADLLVDLHTSGSHYDMPFLAGYHGPTPDHRSVARTAAEAFGADFVWRHPGRGVGRTTSVVDQAIYAESPGSGPTSLDRVDAYVAGVLDVLTVLGLVDGEPRARSTPAITVTGGGDLDRDMLSVGHDGYFITEVGAGDRVVAGSRLGFVVAPDGRHLEDVVAPIGGRVMALKHRSSVKAGDLVANLAGEE
jgi:predicted deacylase